MEEKMAFEREIYTTADNPYTSWLEVATEKALFEEWLKQHLPFMKLAAIKNRPLSVLDFGCSAGSTSMRLMRAMEQLGIGYRYTGVDPYREQLDRFACLAAKARLPIPRLVVGDVESHIPDQPYDLVLASHSLYYVSDMRAAVERIVSAGCEVIVVHHGQRGINTFHERFRPEIKAGPHIISTDEDVARSLLRINLGDRTVKRHAFPSTVDISSCPDPNSRRGQNLLSFFFERVYETIPSSVIEEARVFLTQTYQPDYQMVHDVGVFVIT